ncbi:hypothetical protein A3731_04285 [Roseovarius sp. HI0049]|nr:hypothetical protein A3731_04285 [Roseovarius sp. HI0049]
MKIHRNTPDLLVAEQVPLLLAIALFAFTMAFVTPGVLLVFAGEWLGLAFGGMGGGLGFAAICVFVERLQITLDAVARTATIRRRTVLSHREVTLPLAELVRATTESTRSSGKTRQRLFRPTLVLDDGTGTGETLHPITEVFSSGTGAARLVAAINDWLAASRDTKQPA